MEDSLALLLDLRAGAGSESDISEDDAFSDDEDKADEPPDMGQELLDILKEEKQSYLQSLSGRQPYGKQKGEIEQGFH